METAGNRMWNVMFAANCSRARSRASIAGFLRRVTPRTAAQHTCSDNPPMPRYRLDATDIRGHRFHVTCTVERPAPHQRISLPAWIPGSYLVREFARHLSGLRAHQRGGPVAVRQIDKATWEVDAAGDAELLLEYDVHAFDTSVRAAWLDAERGFFNGTSVFVRIEGAENDA